VFQIGWFVASYIVSQPTILEEHPDGASSETGFLVARVTPRTSPELFATGSYRDRFTIGSR
jgi:hypothetical protein